MKQMNAERWEQIKNIFESALEASPDERAAVLESACSGDTELKQEVARLLAELDQAGGFLEEPRKTAFDAGDLVLGRYRIIRLLGRGGMGEVYEAHDQFLDEAIALKTLRADLSHDPAFIRHFRKEIQLARKITHPNVCRVFEVGTHEFSDDRPALTVFTMELIAGETLQKRIETRGSLTPADAFPLIAQIADGLHAAHQAGIIHGDFKSGNILLAGDRAVITDFGLARVEFSPESSATGRTTGTGGQLAGTIAYMSPEQLSGAPLTPASDIYAFGVVLFEMATGRLPFDGSNVIRSAVQRVTGTRIPVRSLAPQIPHRWEAVIARCMDREPSRRPRNLAKLAEQFRGKRSLRGPSRLAASAAQAGGSRRDGRPVCSGVPFFRCSTHVFTNPQRRIGNHRDADNECDGRAEIRRINRGPAHQHRAIITLLVPGILRGCRPCSRVCAAIPTLL